jgi:hypothetical protein
MSNTDQADNRGGFYMVDNRIIEEYGSIIGVFGIAVYNLIAKYSNEKGENAFPSYQTIADKLGISRPKAVTTINQLVELGLIKKEKRRDDAGDSTSNLYTIVPMGGGKPHLPPSTSDLPQVVNDINHGGKPRLPYQDVINKNHITETPTEHDDWFDAVCWLVFGHKDYELLSKTDKVAIGKTIKDIQASKNKYTINDLRAWYRDKWSNEWPGKQKGVADIQKPTLKQIKAGIGQVKPSSNEFNSQSKPNKSIQVVKELEK